MRTWFEHILFQTRAQPQKPALVMEDRVVTYGMLGAGIDRCARRIAMARIDPSGPVAVRVSNPIRHLTLCLALFRAGLASVSLEQDQTGVTGLTFAAELRDGETTGPIGPGSRHIDVTDDWFASDVPLDNVPLAGFRDATQTCRFSLTSGSTGTPNRVPHTVDGIGQRILEKLLGCIDASRTAVLCMPGLSTILGFSTSCAALTAGRTLCFAEFPLQAVRMIELFSVDVVMAATEQLLALTRATRTSGAQLRSLRTAWVTGGTPTRPLLEAAMIYVCKDIFCRYGVSEVGLVAVTTGRELLAQPTLVGHVVPGVEIGIFDPHGNPCATGAVGIIKRRRDAEPAHDAPRDPWITLGDRGWITPDGQLHIVGRTSDTARAGRELSPVHEAEHVLRLEWDVTDAAAVLVDEGGRPDIWIGVVDGVDISVEALTAMLRRRGIDHPIRLFRLPAIPRSVNGKVNRDQLKALMLASTVSLSGTLRAR
jgi:acyl-coenzyme A synthetase/AMP-(fatty) acid ligase